MEVNNSFALPESSFLTGICKFSFSFTTPKSSISNNLNLQEKVFANWLKGRKLVPITREGNDSL